MKSGGDGDRENSAALADQWAMFEELVGESAFQADGSEDKPAPPPPPPPVPEPPSTDAANGVANTKNKTKDKKEDSASSDDRYC